MTSEEICACYTPDDIDPVLRAISCTATQIVKHTGCSWVEAIAFIRDTLDKVVEKMGGVD